MAEQRRLQAKVLTVSDGVETGEKPDSAGAALADRLRESGFDVIECRAVGDDVSEVSNALSYMAYGFNGLIVTNGGTGFEPRDITPEATRRILDAVALTGPITQAELDDAKAYRIGIAPLANETSADIASQAAVLAGAGLTTAYVGEHTDAMRAVTVEEATATWRELVRADDLVVAVAGDAEALQHQLQGLDPQVIDLQ